MARAASADMLIKDLTKALKGFERIDEKVFLLMKLTFNGNKHDDYEVPQFNICEKTDTQQEWGGIKPNRLHVGSISQDLALTIRYAVGESLALAGKLVREKRNANTGSDDENENENEPFGEAPSDDDDDHEETCDALCCYCGTMMTEFSLSRDPRLEEQERSSSDEEGLQASSESSLVKRKEPEQGEKNGDSKKFKK